MGEKYVIEKRNFVARNYFVLWACKLAKSKEIKFIFDRKESSKGLFIIILGFSDPRRGLRSLGEWI